MALYLGNEKLGAVIKKERHCAKGTVTSDANGVITFPELDFTPTMITVWNITQTDWSKNEEWEEGWVRYTYNGILLTAVYQNGTWISQAPISNSGSICISNASFCKNAVTVNNNIYSYDLAVRQSVDKDHEGECDVSNVVFNYAIYG